MTIVVDVDANLRAAGHQADEQADQRAAGHRPDRLPGRRPRTGAGARPHHQETRTAVLKEAEIFGARVVDSSVEGFAIEATGDPEKLDEFIDVMRSYGEIEVTRSGLVAVSLEAKKLRLQPPVPHRRARTVEETIPETECNQWLNAITKKTADLTATERPRRSPSSATAARATRTR